jgi:hypothetical protein
MNEEIQGICEHHKCGEPITNNNNCLFINYSGGYGDFIDSWVRPQSEMGLCHKHSHQFFNMIYGYQNYGSGSHSGKEPGYSRWHIRWEVSMYSIKIYIFPLLTMLFRNPKLIREFIKDKREYHKDGS